MAKRNSAPPADGSATDERQIPAMIEEQRQQVFNTLAIIEMARDQAEEEDGSTEGRVMTNLWRSLTIAAERLEKMAEELHSIANNAQEVGNG